MNLQFHRTGVLRLTSFWVLLSTGMRPARLALSGRDLKKLCLFELAFYIGYIYANSFTHRMAAPFWFPDAVLLCALLLTSPGQWWIYLVAPLPIRLLVGVPPDVSGWFLAATCLNDSLKALLGALALRCFLKKPVRFDTVRDLLIFGFFAVALLPVLSAFGGAWSRATLGFAFGPAWQQWFLGDALASLILTPAILYWAVGGYEALRAASWRRWLEGSLAGVGLTATALLAFVPWINNGYDLPARLYAPIPFLAWIAIRFGLRGASAGLSLIAALAILGAVKGQGRFSSLEPELNVLSIQLFLLVTGVPTLLLAALSAERSGAILSLKESQNRLQAILNTAVEGIITSNERGVIESVNAATERIFGYAAAEMVGQNVSLLMPAPGCEEHGQHPANHHQTRQPGNIDIGREVGGRRKDGSTFPLHLSVSELELKDRRIFTGLVRDLTERKQAEQAAREFGGRLLQAQERERARLARELHDDITQRLARMAIDAGRIERAAGTSQISGTMRSMRDGLIRLSEDVHSLSYRLHPSVLEELGLAEALKAECERFSRQERVPATVTLGEQPDLVPVETGFCLFRVAQEALRNAARHARARKVEVSMRSFDGGMHLAVLDDGIGFDPAAHREQPTLGLASMRERVALIGGELEIDSTPGRGTTVLAWVPLNQGPA